MLIKALLAICPHLLPHPHSATVFPLWTVHIIPDHHHSPPQLEKYPHTLISDPPLKGTETNTSHKDRYQLRHSYTHTHRHTVHANSTPCGHGYLDEKTNDGAAWGYLSSCCWRNWGKAQQVGSVIFTALKRTPITLTRFFSKSRHIPKTEWRHKC